MKLSAVNDTILQRMSAKDRKSMGLQTSDEAQAKFIAKSERDLQNQIASFLRVKGIWFCQSRMDRKTTSKVGTPDFLLAYGYRPVAFEVKFGKGKLSEEQDKTATEMIRGGWHHHVVRSLEEVKLILDGLEQTHLSEIKF